MKTSFLTRLSKKLPPRLVGFDANWPMPPAPFREASECLKEMYRMTLVRRFMKPLKPDMREMVRQALLYLHTYL